MRRKSPGVSAGNLVAAISIMTLLIVAGAAYYLYFGPSRIRSTSALGSSTTSSCSTTSTGPSEGSTSTTVCPGGGAGGGGGGAGTTTGTENSTISRSSESLESTESNHTNINVNFEIGGDFSYNGTLDPGPDNETWFASGAFSFNINATSGSGSGTGHGAFEDRDYENNPCNWTTAGEFQYTFNVDANYNSKNGSYTIEFSGPTPAMYNLTGLCPHGADYQYKTSSEHYESVIPQSIQVTMDSYSVEGEEGGVHYEVNVEV